MFVHWISGSIIFTKFHGMTHSLFETFLVTQSTIWRKEKVIAYINKYKIFVFDELQFFVEFLFLKDEIVLRSLSSSSTW